MIYVGARQPTFSSFKEHFDQVKTGRMVRGELGALPQTPRFFGLVFQNGDEKDDAGYPNIAISQNLVNPSG